MSKPCLFLVYVLSMSLLCLVYLLSMSCLCVVYVLSKSFLCLFYFSSMHSYFQVCDHPPPLFHIIWPHIMFGVGTSKNFPNLVIYEIWRKNLTVSDRRTDGQTDRRKDKVRYRGACYAPKNIYKRNLNYNLKIYV